MLLTSGFARFKISTELSEAVSGVFAASHQFFDLPLHEKMQNRLNLDLGYRPYGVEYSASAAHPDQIESFSASHRIAPAQVKLPSLAARTLYDEALNAFTLLEAVGEALVVALAREVSQEIDLTRFAGALHSWTLLQLNRSHPPQIDTDQVSELHEDGCLLTLMTHDGPGLEVLGRDGQFIPITLSSDEMLAIPGEILTLLTGGLVRPLYHRVRTTPAAERRMAMLLFADIDPALCTPWLSSVENSGMNIGERVLKNAQRYGLNEWEA